MIQSIIKRDGRVVLYEQGKIASAVLKSLEATGEGNAVERTFAVYAPDSLEAVVNALLPQH